MMSTTKTKRISASYGNPLPHTRKQANAKSLLEENRPKPISTSTSGRGGGLLRKSKSPRGVTESCDIVLPPISLKSPKEETKSKLPSVFSGKRLEKRENKQTKSEMACISRNKADTALYPSIQKRLLRKLSSFTESNDKKCNESKEIIENAPVVSLNPTNESLSRKLLRKLSSFTASNDESRGCTSEEIMSKGDGERSEISTKRRGEKSGKDVRLLRKITSFSSQDSYMSVDAKNACAISTGKLTSSLSKRLLRKLSSFSGEEKGKRKDDYMLNIVTVGEPRHQQLWDSQKSIHHQDKHDCENELDDVNTKSVEFENEETFRKEFDHINGREFAQVAAVKKTSVMKTFISKSNKNIFTVRGTEADSDEEFDSNAEEMEKIAALVRELERKEQEEISTRCGFIPDFSPHTSKRRAGITVRKMGDVFDRKAAKLYADELNGDRFLSDDEFDRFSSDGDCDDFD